MEDCGKAKAGDAAAGAVCYERAGVFDTAGAKYAAKEEMALQNELNDAFAGCVDFAKVCAKIVPSEACSNYVETMASLFRMHIEQTAKSG